MGVARKILLAHRRAEGSRSEEELAECGVSSTHRLPTGITPDRPQRTSYTRTRPTACIPANQGEPGGFRDIRKQPLIKGFIPEVAGSNPVPATMGHSGNTRKSFRILIEEGPARLRNRSGPFSLRGDVCPCWSVPSRASDMNARRTEQPAGTRPYPYRVVLADARRRVRTAL